MGAKAWRSFKQDLPLGEVLNRELYRSVQFSIQEQLLRSSEKRFREELVFKARRLFVSINFRPRVIKKRREALRRLGSRRRFCPLSNPFATQAAKKYACSGGTIGR